MEAADETHEGRCAMKSDAVEWTRKADAAGLDPWVIIKADGTRGLYTRCPSEGILPPLSNEECEEIAAHLVDTGRVLRAPATTHYMD